MFKCILVGAYLCIMYTLHNRVSLKVHAIGTHRVPLEVTAVGCSKCHQFWDVFKVVPLQVSRSEPTNESSLSSNTHSVHFDRILTWQFKPRLKVSRAVSFLLFLAV